MNILKGHGPSKAELIDKGSYQIVRKNFNIDEQRRDREVKKLEYLELIAQCYKVPKVLEVGKAENNFYYDLEYIKNSSELSIAGKYLESWFIKEQLFNIIDNLCLVKAKDNVWTTMIDKFNEVKIIDPEYYELINSLPKNIEFKKGYSHGDLSFDNILVDGGTEFYLIDPAWSNIESPLWDVGKIMQSTLINWNGIKSTGKALGSEREDWIDNLLFLKSRGDTILTKLIDTFTIDGVILSTACQLSRVSRWCFSETLIPIVKNLLKLYLNGDKDGNFDALCRII